MVGGMCLCIAFSGVMLGAGQVGNLAPWTRIAAAAACVVIAVLVLYHVSQSRKTYRIDISGVGQIRLTEFKGLATPLSAGGSEVVQLAADSTLWPKLLRLQAEDRRIAVLPILPDSVAVSEFRALSVACRWIAAHNISTEGRLP
jgi:toxin CptA